MMTRCDPRAPTPECERCLRYDAHARPAPTEVVIDASKLPRIGGVCPMLSQEILPEPPVKKPEPPPAKKRRRLVGAGGKARMVPTGTQAKFTVNGSVVVPVKLATACPPEAFGNRSYVAPEHRGEFSALGPGRYVE